VFFFEQVKDGLRRQVSMVEEEAEEKYSPKGF
jgi:hypothetical protein